MVTPFQRVVPLKRKENYCTDFSSPSCHHFGEEDTLCHAVMAFNNVSYSLFLRPTTFKSHLAQIRCFSVDGIAAITYDDSCDCSAWDYTRQRWWRQSSHQSLHKCVVRITSHRVNLTLFVYDTQYGR